MNQDHVFYSVLIIVCLLPMLGYGQIQNDQNKEFHQSSQPNIFHNNKGDTIEYLGLRTWKASQVQDSLKKLAPNKAIQCCEHLLVDRLGFAESQVQLYQYRPDATFYAVVLLVEKENRLDKIKFSKNKKPTIQKWKGDFNLDVVKLNTALPFRRENWLEKSSFTDKIKDNPLLSDEDVRYFTQFRDHITSFDSQADRKLAVKTLKEDANIINRFLASFVLLNFENDKQEKYLALKQIRLNDSQMSNLSARMVQLMTQDSQNEDWSGAIESIRALLAGTSLSALREVLSVLTQTQISSTLADKVLENNSYLIRELLSANFDQMSLMALDFVNQISGKEFETAQAACKWLEHI